MSLVDGSATPHFAAAHDIGAVHQLQRRASHLLGHEDGSATPLQITNGLADATEPHWGQPQEGLIEQ